MDMHINPVKIENPINGTGSPEMRPGPPGRCNRGMVEALNLTPEGSDSPISLRKVESFRPVILTVLSQARKEEVGRFEPFHWHQAQGRSWTGLGRRTLFGVHRTSEGRTFPYAPAFPLVTL